MPPLRAYWTSSDIPRSWRRSSSAATGGASGAHAEALHPELLGQRLGARGDRAPQLVRLEQDRPAAEREHLALEPLVAADRQFANRAAVGEQPGTALDRPARDLLVVEEPGGARVAEPRRLEALAGLEPLPRQLRAAHPVEPERPCPVARPVPRVDIPVRQLPFERVRLDEAGRRCRIGLLLVLDLDDLSLSHAAREGRDEVDLLGRDLRLGSLRELELPKRLLELLAHAGEWRVGV